MYQARTEFLQQKIRETSWDRKDYIGTLMQMEDAIAEGAGGYANALWMHAMKQKYAYEYEAMRRELRPAQYTEEALAQQAAAIRERMEKEKAEEEARRRKEEQAYQDWMAAGGQS